MKSTSDDGPAGRLSMANNRCVWMEAGILSYLLCDREFECDHCPLDEAMRSHFSGDVTRGAPPPSPRAAGDSSRRPRPESLYTPAHLKVSFLDGGTCRLSLEPGIAGLLPPVRSVVLPRKGEHISPDGFCCWLIFEGGTLPVKLPFGATAGEGNPLLADRPHILNGPAADDGWLFEFEPDDRNAARKTLLNDRDATLKFGTDREMFMSLVMECVHPEGTNVGRTFQDGGRFVDDLATLIGPVKYLGILRRVYWGHR